MNIWKNVIVTTDCLHATMIILQGPIFNINESNEIPLCRELLQDQRGISLLFEGRGTNKLADSMAKNAKGKTDGLTTYVF